MVYKAPTTQKNVALMKERGNKKVKQIASRKINSRNVKRGVNFRLIIQKVHARIKFELIPDIVLYTFGLFLHQFVTDFHLKRRPEVPPLCFRRYLLN